MNEAIESAAKAAVAAAVLAPTAIEDVTIRPNPAQAVAVHRPGRQRARTSGAERVHPAAGGAVPTRGPAHAAHRRAADPGPERNPCPARRVAGTRSPGKAANVAVATDCLGRPRPPRTGGSADADPAIRVPVCRPRLQNGCRAGRCRVQPIRGRSRSPSTPSGPRRKVLTPSAGKLLCITGGKKTSSISRRSCAARPIERPRCGTRYRFRRRTHRDRDRPSGQGVNG